MKRALVILLLLLEFAVAHDAHASTVSPREYTIELPHHRLHFSLPEEIAREMNPLQVDGKFLTTEQSYLKSGFVVLADHLHDFNGPFWVGAYGSLKFSFMVIRRSTESQQEIVSLPGLERYIQWWIADGKNAGVFTYGRGKVNGTEWPVRLQNTFGHAPTSAEPNSVDVEIFSCPLDADMFLEAGFRITEWVPGSAKKWKDKAEKLRDSIKATITVEPKTW